MRRLAIVLAIAIMKLEVISFKVACEAGRNRNKRNVTSAPLKKKRVELGLIKDLSFDKEVTHKISKKR